jgi:hypothetical protein
VPPGKFRKLMPKEVERLKSASGIRLPVGKPSVA